MCQKRDSIWNNHQNCFSFYFITFEIIIQCFKCFVYIYNWVHLFLSKCFEYFFFAKLYKWFSMYFFTWKQILHGFLYCFWLLYGILLVFGNWSTLCLRAEKKSREFCFENEKIIIRVVNCTSCKINNRKDNRIQIKCNWKWSAACNLVEKRVDSLLAFVYLIKGK